MDDDDCGGDDDDDDDHGSRLGQHLDEVAVVEAERPLGPCAVEAAPLGVAAADCVRARQRDDVAVGEVLRAASPPAASRGAATR